MSTITETTTETTATPAPSSREEARRANTLDNLCFLLATVPPEEVHERIERAALGAVHYLRESGECSLEQHIRACGFVSVAREIAVSLDEATQASIMRRAADALDLFDAESATWRTFAVTFAARVGNILIHTSRRRQDAGYWRAIASLLLLAIDDAENASADTTHGVRECFLHSFGAV